MTAFSKHAQTRARQRAIPPIVFDWLDEYGEELFDGRGAIVRFFSCEGRRRMERDFGRQFVQRNQAVFASLRCRESGRTDDHNRLAFQSDQKEVAMLNEREVQILDRCADYLYELVEIYSSGGTDGRYILKDLEAIERHMRHATKCVASVRPPVASCGEPILWVNDVEAALEALGGRAHLSTITREAVARRKAAGRSVTRCSEATVRDTLHAHSSDAAKFWYGGLNTRDIFKREHALGRGWWSLRSMKVKRP